MKKIRTKYFSIIVLSLFCSLKSIACDCPVVPKLNEAYLKDYQLIFRGSVKSVGECNQLNKVHFVIQELYKGDSPKEIDVLFDCSSDCKMSFYPGETWIIYANFAQVGKPKVEICSRSRKLVDNEIKLSTKFIATDFNFNEECTWLKTNIGLKNFLEENENSKLSHRNQLPDRTSQLILIACSLGGLLLVYFLIKKFLK